MIDLDDIWEWLGFKQKVNAKTFKSMCLKAGTKKADEIHDYFIKLEEILQEIIHEESNVK